MATKMMEAIKIFYCYAHEDKALRDELEKHLAALKRVGQIAEWYDQEIQAGKEWEQEINEHLNMADVVLLLVSPDFIHSDQCYSIEMRQALEKHYRKEARVIPIILRPVDWERTPIGKLQALPLEGKPITTWLNRDEAFRDVARGIQRTIEEITAVSPVSLLSHPKIASQYSTRDWGEILDIARFSGRKDDLILLRTQILEEHCRVIHIGGKGGIGKTTLVATLVKQIADQFDFVFWRSLINARSFPTVFQECIQLLSNQQEVSLPESPAEQQLLMLKYLRQYRCLLVLDNIDTVTNNDDYKRGFKDYGAFFRLIGEVEHASCLVLTSRNKPKDVALLEDAVKTTLSVRTHILKGMSTAECQELLKGFNLVGTQTQWNTLVECYSGNPKLLEIVAASIRDIYEGAINDYLESEPQALSDVQELMHSQFRRLSERQKEVMYWLAVRREPTPVNSLYEYIVGLDAKKGILETIHKLLRSSLIDRDKHGYMLQNVILEYVTDRLIQKACSEIIKGSIQVLNKIPLITTQSKEYIREGQTRIILDTLLATLQETLSKDEIESCLNTLLSKLRGVQQFKNGYAGGNIFNLFNHLRADISNYNFSDVAVWQGNFQGVEAYNLNLTKADLKGALFTETFGIVLCGIFSPKQDLIAASANNGEVYAWQITDKKQFFGQSAQNHWAKAVAFSFDGTRIASGGTNFVRVFAIFPQRKFLKELYIDVDRILALQFSAEGRLLVCGSRDHLVSVWDVDTGACIATLLGHNGRIITAKFNTEVNILVTGSTDHTIRLWNIALQTCLCVFEGHGNWVRDVTISEDTRLIASGSEDKTVRVWDVLSGECIATLYGHTARVSAVAFSTGNQLLASGGEDTTIRLWNIRDSLCIGTFTGHTNWVLTLAFSSDGHKLVSGGEDRTVRLWTLLEANLASETNFINGYCDAIYRGYMNRPFSIACSPNGKYVASGWEDGMIRIWDIPKGICIKTLRGHSGWIRSIAFSQNGQYLASAGADHTIRLWNTRNWQCTRELVGDITFGSIAFAPDGSKLASSSEHIIQIWYLTIRDEVRTFEGHIDTIQHIEFDSIGRTLISCGNDGTIRLWNANTGECLETLREHINRISSFAFNADRSLLVTGSEDRTVKIWDTSSRTCIKTLYGHSSQVWSVSLTRDGAFAASGGQDLTIRLWDVNTGECRWIAEGHQDIVWKTTFSPNGKIVVSAGYDGTIKYWDINTGKCLRTLQVPRPYSGMNITEAKGLTLAQKETLKLLGAIEGL